MIAGRKVVAVITARGGSKGLPRKNVLPLGGKPLIAWTVEAAKASRYVDRVVLSSDDPEIIAAAVAAGAEAPFVRPAELAGDAAGSVDVMLHALDAIGAESDLAVLLQPTSPLRRAADIDACVEACAAGATSCVTVTEAAKPPFWMFFRTADGRLNRVVEPPPGAHRRQDLPPAFVVNGAVYVVAVEWFRAERTFVDANTRSVIMPPERSVDIDTATDFALAACLLG